eukprot:m.1405405 g.1405405  ORF g.1405405 m.1405405 type:complete len:413 (+) comp25012_c0_seq87:1372-2610(+)
MHHCALSVLPMSRCALCVGRPQHGHCGRPAGTAAHHGGGGRQPRPPRAANHVPHLSPRCHDQRQTPRGCGVAGWYVQQRVGRDLHLVSASLWMKGGVADAWACYGRCDDGRWVDAFRCCVAVVVIYGRAVLHETPIESHQRTVAHRRLWDCMWLCHHIPAANHCNELIQWARTSLVPAAASSCAATKGTAGKTRTSSRTTTTKKRKGTDATASTSTIENVHPYISLVCTTAVEAFKLGLVRADRASDAGLYSAIHALCIDIIALDTGACHHAKEVGRLLCELVLCDVTASTTADTVHLDERTSAAVAQWLLAAAAHSDATLIAIRPAVTALAKICQQNRCLPVLLGVVARVCVKLSNSGQTTALNFFVSLVTKSSVLLSAFVGELPTDPTNAEDVVDVVSTPSLPIQEHYVM